MNTPAPPRRRLLGVAILLLVSAPAWSQSRDQLLRRAQSVATLIESSSVARQIDASGVAEARDRRDAARLIQREAQALLDAGQLDGVAPLLDQAAREMMAGARLANRDQVVGEKNRSDFERRLDSTRALLAAQQRITGETGASGEALEAARLIEQQIATAQQFAAQGRYDIARPLLDRAYLTTRVSIESLRRGATLVRSLSFATPREEYAYETDRNDTHRMLVRVVLADRKEAAGTPPASMQASLGRADQLRAEAEALAAAGNLADAIHRMEESTRELVRAIRAGGLYIPG